MGCDGVTVGLSTSEWVHVYTDVHVCVQMMGVCARVYVGECACVILSGMCVHVYV